MMKTNKHAGNVARGGKRSRRSRRNTQTTYPVEGRGNISAGRGPLAALTNVIEPWTPLFPARTVRRLRYADSGTLSSASGVVAGYVLRANDCFDPDFTSTGHQPMGFDQMMVFYNHFHVLRSRLVCTFKNTTASAPTICLRQDADSSILTDPDRIQEYGGCVLENLEIKGSYGANKTLELEVDMSKIFGLNRQAIAASNNLQGTVGSSPSEINWFHILMWDTTATTGSCTVDFIMEQEVLFTEPRDFTTSLERKQPDTLQDILKRRVGLKPVPPK